MLILSIQTLCYTTQTNVSEEKIMHQTTENVMHYYHTVISIGPDSYFISGGGIEHPKLLSTNEAQQLRADADGLTIRVILVTEQEYRKIETLTNAGLPFLPYGAVRQTDIEPKIIHEEDLQW
ncbi:hypothetical protein [Pseudomonas oryzihabitans]|uniref:hypothetical protein n=1 Tax=Pseudomonas oryzihabitans TaxID=47885 RepID=UPI00241CB9B5|nr:hypothetical protein [Pseudomonas oryzihabitans]